MVRQCSLRHRFPVCSSGGNSNPKSSFWRLVDLLSLSYREVELLSQGRVCTPITFYGMALGPAVCPRNGSERLRSRLRRTNDSWRVDKTYIRVKGNECCSLRAVDSSSETIDFLLSAKRDAAAAERFLAKALGGENHLTPRVINTDEYDGYPPAIVRLKAEEALKEVSIDRCNISTTFWNRIIGRSSAGYAQASIFARSGELGVRSPATKQSMWSPQRPGVQKRAGGEGRCTPLLHSWFVQRGDGLILRTLSPNFALTPKLEHYLMAPAHRTFKNLIPRALSKSSNQSIVIKKEMVRR